MKRWRGRWVALAALATAAIAWLGAAELAAEARVVTVVLVALLPALLLGQAAIDDDEAANLPVVPAYLTSIVMIAVIGAAAAWAGLRSGLRPTELGLAPVEPVHGLVWTGGVTLLALALLAAGRLLGRRESALLSRLLPRTGAQRAVFIVLSLCAGVGEELAYRGFLIPALEVASGSTWLALLVSSVAFGMVHSYQGTAGVMRASALGAVLAAPLLVTGSLYPSIAAHALIDLIAGLALGDWLASPSRERDADSSHEH
jgi:membrane protease YdiL (CAAX protease family)